MLFQGKKKKPAFSDSSSPREDSLPRLVCNEAGIIVFANPAFETMTQAAKASLRGKSILDILSLNDLQLRFDWVERGDGTRFMIVSPASDTSNDKSTILSTLEEDLSSAKPLYFDADDAKELNHFLDMSHELMCVLDEDGVFKRTNDTFCALLKTDSAILNGRSFLDVVHPEDRSFVRQALSDVLNDEIHNHPMDYECRMVAGDGSVLWIEWRHKAVDAVLYSVGHDLTAIKKHEDRLEREHLKLLEAEAIGKMGHWHWTLGQDAFDWSPEIYTIFGLQQDDFIPTLDTVNELVRRRDMERILQVFQRAMIENNDYEIDFQATRPDGQAVMIRCVGRCETDESGDVVGLYGIMQDITQDMQKEQAMREAKEAVERAYAAKTQFLANMSHELRTPLNAIIGFSEMIQNQLLGPVGNEKYLDYIGGIRESGEHLLDLISDILDMSKIEAGKYQLDLEQCNAAKVIRMAAHMMEGRALDASIRIISQMDSESLPIIADRRALMQMTLNLLSNAVKFSKPNSEVIVECGSSHNNLTIRVIDSGIGIPAHKIHSVTNPFEQVSSSYTREHEGTGLGLAITKELAEMHGGSLHIESTLGLGTTVTIRLPLDASKATKP